MEEKKGNQKCIRYFWLFVFFLFVFGCQPKALQEERKGEKPQIIASVCGQSPKEFVNSFLTILAKSHPALSWVDPKTMTDMVFSIVKAQAPFTNEVSFDRPYWMGAFTAKCNDLGFFGVLPVKGSLGAKKIMDHFFVHEGRFSGIYRYRTKSQKKVWWVQEKGYLLVSSHRPFLDSLREKFFPQFRLHPPQKALEANVWLKRVKKQWGIKLKETLSMVAVFYRFGFLSSRSQVKDSFFSRFGVALKSLVDQWLAGWAKISEHVEKIGFHLSIDEKRAFFEGVVRPTKATNLSTILLGSRPGRPVGFALLEDRPFFVYGHRLGWESNGTDPLVKTVSYLLEPGIESSKQRIEIQQRLRDFFRNIFGDFTLSFHGASPGQKEGNFLGMSGVMRVRDANRLRKSFGDLQKSLMKIRVARIFSEEELRFIQNCFHLHKGRVGEKKKQEDFLRIDFDGVQCPGVLPMALVAIFGKPSLEFSFYTGKARVLWTAGPQSGRRLNRLVMRVNKKKYKPPKRGLMKTLGDHVASGWIAFSPIAFIQETKLFGLPTTKKWVDAVKGIQGGGGVVFSWGTQKGPLGERREAFVRMAIDNQEMGRLLQAMTRSSGNVFGKIFKDAVNRDR